MSVDQALEDARALLGWLERTRPEVFTRRQAFTGLSRARFPKVTDLDPALELLEQHDYIRRLPDPPRSGPRRPPSPTYLAHPSLVSRS
jgi:replicative DNA helicase